VYNSDRVIAFAIAEKETNNLYQLGYETLPEYRQKGIATAITIEMTNFLINKRIIPYATLAWSNISSKNVLIKSGYTMAWSDMGSYND
jgi:predicted GNAT family acetyltransferase